MAKTTKELKALITLAGKIDPSLQKALVDAAKKTKGVGKELTLLQRLSDKSFKLLKLGAKSAAVGIASMAAAGTAALVKFGKAGLDNAMELEKLNGTIGAVFGEGADRVDAWSRSLLKAYGLSELSAKRYSSTMGALLVNEGLAAKDAATMSQNLTMLAADMASFYNQDPEETFSLLESAMSGSAGALKKLGIQMSAADLEAFALSEGVGKSYAAMNSAEQTALRYNYVLGKTQNVQGDFARDTDKLANQQKIAKERFTDLSTSIMSRVLPSGVQLMQVFNDVMDSMDTAALGDFIAGVGDLAVQLAPLIMDLLPVALDTVKLLLPPLLEIIKLVLPPMTKFFELIVKVLSGALAVGADFIAKIAGFFKGGGTPVASSEGLDQYAEGGFARKRSIFGEAGLEVAIPIRRGNPRSLTLLQKTAELLGAAPRRQEGTAEVGIARHGRPLLQKMAELTGMAPRHPGSGAEGGFVRRPDGVRGALFGLPTRDGPVDWSRHRMGEMLEFYGGGVHLTYAPVFRGVERDKIEPLLKQQVPDIEAMLARVERKRRLFEFG